MENSLGAAAERIMLWYCWKADKKKANYTAHGNEVDEI